MARTGTALSHNPGSNLRLFAGIAPLAGFHAAGLTLGLGMDATTLDDDEDMFAEMRLALRLSRDPLAPETAPSVADIFGMATAGGARLLRREKTLGKLLPSYAADLVVLDLDRLMAPWVAPECDPLTLVILRAQRRDVETVMVGGEVVFANGRPTRFDIDAAGRAMAELMASRPYPVEGAVAVRTVTPRLRRWYEEGWAQDRTLADPWLSYNSRA
jgi:cytosine/adenosine deaminase-related metal-dependent hydrolase